MAPPRCARLVSRREADRAAYPGVDERHDETLSSSDLQWDEAADEYCCPQGKVLRKQRRTFQNLRSHIAGGHHHLSSQPVRLCELPAEAALLSEYTDAQDR